MFLICESDILKSGSCESDIFEEVGVMRMSCFGKFIVNFVSLTAQLQTIRELGFSIRKSYRIIQDLQSLGISEYQIDKTPLHLAVKIGQDDIFWNVFKVSEDKNPADRFGRTPLHYAAKFGRFNLVEIMIKSGIKDLSTRTKMNIIAPIVGNLCLFQV